MRGKEQSTSKKFHIPTALRTLAVIFGIPCALIALCSLTLGQKELQMDVTKFRANRWLKSAYSDVIEITDDSILQELDSPEIDVSGTMLCVRGYGASVFGTQRPYNDVVASYSDWLLARGWRESAIPEGRDTPITHLYFIPDDDWSRTVTVSKWELEDQLVEHHTIYRIAVYFTEIRCTEFCPGWRCPE